METYDVYVLTNADGCIFAVQSSAHLHSTSGWTHIASGTGNRFASAQQQFFPLPLTDDAGVYRYKLENGKPVERTQEEKDADYTPPEEAPVIGDGNLAAEVAALRESNAQLQEALELLLSGEVE